ncbi:MAG TPA: alanine racemase [Flavobacteriales bacterium]|nr:alanine racemase [Flavobacteriales bacterium]
MFEPSSITISRGALRSNIAFIKERLGPARLCGVVKGNAYGHGLEHFVQLALAEGVDYFGVYSADEAWIVRQHVNARPDLFIMGMVEGDGLAWAVEQGVEFCVHDRDRLEHAVAQAKKQGSKARIHVEVETGMHRTGFSLPDLEKTIPMITAAAGHLDLVGLFTHFAGAESRSNHDRVISQMACFERARKLLEDSGIPVRYAHQACSAAVMNYPGTIGPMARVGIMQYGFWSNAETWLRYSLTNKTAADPLRRVIGWRSRVMAITEVEAGGLIGYGNSAMAPGRMRIAVVPVGYAHGFDRGLSNMGRVLIRGEQARVTGIVNMNAISVDVSTIPGVEKGDEVVLIGAQGSQAITVASFGEMSEQLNYELLTRLPRNIPRILID